MKALLAFLALAAAVFGLQRCTDAPVTHSRVLWKPDVWSFLTHAAARGDIPVIVLGHAFGRKAEEFADIIVDAMRGQTWGPQVAFNRTPGPGADTDYRIIFLFDPPANANGLDICARGADIAREKFRQDILSQGQSTPGPLVVTAALCHRNEPLSEVTGELRDPHDPADPRFRKLIGQIVRELLPEPRHDP